MARVPQTAAAKALREEPEQLYKSPIHVWQRGEALQQREVDITNSAAEVEFESPRSRRLTITRGVNAQQLQAMRRLTVRALRRLEALWKSASKDHH
jgi:hypothetical protein